MDGAAIAYVAPSDAGMAMDLAPIPTEALFNNRERPNVAVLANLRRRMDGCMVKSCGVRLGFSGPLQNACECSVGSLLDRVKASGRSWLVM